LMRALVWFRNDLRVHDNAALSRASRSATRGVVGVFLLSPGQWQEHDWAAVKVDFVLRTLVELRTSLAKLNIPLLVRPADRFDVADAALLGIAKEHACDAMWFNREYEVNERERDERVTGVFERAGCSVQACDDQVVLEPGSVRTNDDRPYTVYSPFKRKWYEVFTDRQAEPGVAEWPMPKKQPAGIGIESDQIPSVVDGFSSTVDPSLWPAGEVAALRRLKTFLAEVGPTYKVVRDYPAQPGTSVQSPYLAIGAISPRVCVHRAIEANGGKLSKGNEGLVHWIGEVIWREFYKHLLVAFPRLCKGRPFQLATDRVQWRDDPQGFEAWKAGRTGYPIVDAGMRQLHETGWMHNRVRMITAMFLTKDLLLDWRLGERHFMRHLVDGDLSQNNGGWQWSASTGTDAQPYFRVFNPFSQSKKFDEDGVYIRRWVPELRDVSAATLHDPALLEKQFGGRALGDGARLFGGDGETLADYPASIVDHGMARERAIEAFKSVK